MRRGDGGVGEWMDGCGEGSQRAFHFNTTYY